MSACLVKMIWVKDQHAQAQQWLMHAQAWAQAQHWIMHGQARAQAQLQRQRLSMHDALLSLSMPVLDPNHPD